MMLELLFNVSNDPLLYIVTFSVLINFSGITAWVFLSRRHYTFLFRRPDSFKGDLSVQPPHPNHLLIMGQLNRWITLLVRRKESPQDDSDDHHFLLIS